jgi:hypothetical protein
MIADQQTGKNSGPPLANYQNGASVIQLFSIFCVIKKIILKIFRTSGLVK